MSEERHTHAQSPGIQVRYIAHKRALLAGASLVHLGLGHRDYKHHKVSAALMLIVLTLFEVAALLPLSANLFAVLGESTP